jgi:hypothetical protein
MHQITYGAAGSYPHTVCGLKLERDRFHHCGPRFLTEHCTRLGIEPCAPCWTPRAEQLGLDLGRTA